MVKDINEMKGLVRKLNYYRNEYYNNSNSVISDETYDILFNQLEELERETGIIISGSPTQTVGYEVVSKLEKVKHSHPLLSLSKTKSVDDLLKLAASEPCLLMHKLDGLTILLTYDGGRLIQAETRGNGEVGELVTHNAREFINIPLVIGYNERLEIEAEAIITYEDFAVINEALTDEEKYKNPRNLVSGSVRQLDNRVAAERKIRCIAWKVPAKNFGRQMSTNLDALEKLGFDVVPFISCPFDDVQQITRLIESLKDEAKDRGYPIDGLVISYDDMIYGQSLGSTGHHPRHSLAFKFYDEEHLTTLRDIEWSMGKTGSLTPVAIFDTVNIDGTDVSRASLHNVSILKELELGIGDEISVYKANQIIPQVKENNTRSNAVRIPGVCPVCSEATKVEKDIDTEVLHCTNEFCKGKLVGKLTHFCSKNALNIDGMSEATIEFLVDRGWVKSFIDLYNLDQYKDEWSRSDRFGKRSVEKLLESLMMSKNTTLDRFIYSLSIPLIGRSASKAIASSFENEVKFYDSWCSGFDFSTLSDFGTSMQNSMWTYLQRNHTWLPNLMDIFEFENVQMAKGTTLDGMTFVITGKLDSFENRDEAKSKIEVLGGKVSGSVSAKTSYLVNNDITSTTGKNKKAKELGVPIISEAQLLEMM